MKKAVMVFILVSVLATALTSWGAAIKDVTVVIEEPVGTVLLKDEPELERKAALMDFLDEGDKLDLGPQAVVVLNYFYSGVRERIQGPGLVIVGLSSSAVDPGMKVERSPVFALPQTIGQDQQMGASVLKGFMADTQESDTQQKDVQPQREMAPWNNGRCEIFLITETGPEKVRLLNLYQTAVSTVRPVFRWRPVDGASQYRIKLFGPQGAILLDAVTSNTSLDLIGPDLGRGRKYLWNVEALDDNGRMAKGEAEFTILTREEYETVSNLKKEITRVHQPGSAELALTYVFLYQRFLLFDEAAAALEPLLEKYPDNKNLVRMMVMLNPLFYP